MNALEFYFSFYGLILGLSVVEVITGFAKVLKARTRIRLGVCTPLLATLLLVDLTTFWRNAWNEWQHMDISLPVLVAGLAVAGVYYLAASLVFPDDLEAWPDLDDFFRVHRLQVVMGIATANIIVQFVVSALVSTPDEYLSALPHRLVGLVAFTSLGFAAALVPRLKWSAALLVVILSLYVIF